MRLALLLLLTLVATLHGAEPKRLELGFPGLAHRIQVVFPTNYDPAKKYPVFLYYHGTNGKPTTELIRAHMNHDDWFTVGMTYVQQGKFTFTPQTLAAELTIQRSVIRQLTTKYNVDSKRVYVGGFSKGGWLSGLFLQAEPGLAGAAIMGAGHVHQVKTKPPKFKRLTPVFLGIGRQDGNYPFALRSVTFYRGLGATTTLDTWHDHGHQFPQSGSPALKQWLALAGNPDTDHKAAANSWSTSALEDLADIDNPVQRWVALLDLRACPYFTLLNDTQKAAFAKSRRDFEKIPAVSTEAEALAAHRKLLASEIKTRTKENYQRMLREYNILARSIPDSRQGKIAQQDAERITTLLKHFDEQEIIRKKEHEPFGPEPEDDPFDPNKPKPTDDRIRIPRNPLVR